MKKLLIVDTFNLLFRSYYAMRSFRSPSGQPNGMLMGLCNMLYGLNNDEWDAVVFAADSGASFRNELLPEYKANRKELEPELKEQIPIALNMLASAGYALLERQGYEADDIIASLAHTAMSEGFEQIVIYSTDKDLYSLINDRTRILNKDGELIDAAGCEAKFGVLPHQIRDYLALIGDSADNFKGVPGVGPAAAKRLLGEFGSIEGIYENLSVAGTKGLIKKLEDGRESAMLCQKLATLVSDLPVSAVLAAADNDFASKYASLHGYFEELGLFKHLKQARAILHDAPGAERGKNWASSTGGAATGAGSAAVGAAGKFADSVEVQGSATGAGGASASGVVTGGGSANPGLGGFAKDSTGNAAGAGLFPDSAATQSSQHAAAQRAPSRAQFFAHLITSASELERVIACLPDRVGFDTETTGLERHARCVGFSFSAYFEGALHAFYVPLAHIGSQNISHADASAALAQIFTRCIIGHNLNFDFRIIKGNFAAVKLPERFIDSMVLAWLANSSQKLSLDYQSQLLFAHTNVAFEQLVPKGSHFGELSAEEAYFYAAEDAAMTMLIAEHYERHLSEQERRCASFEMEFAKVIFAMKEQGLCADASVLRELKSVLEAASSEQKEQILQTAGVEFNPASPKQLAEVLYDHMGLKAPSNRSTNEAALSALDHPIAQQITTWRNTARVLSTYVSPLLELAGRAQNSFVIHADFMQTGTATGRLACARPNLQNIPARGPWAAAIKQAFIAREGKCLISLDYSQIELRMLAHFSGDEALCRAFLDGADIHAQTAIECFGDVSKRQMAKAINFGLIYGMGARALGLDVGISTAEAKRYIDAYFARFASVREYFDTTRAHARADGYITTLAGRRRYFDYGRSAREDAAHDRECINSILQGSAADLIKTAMIRSHKQLESERAALVLQIHDELVYEVDKELAEEFAQKASALMQNAAALRVPLVTSCKIGHTLAELK